MRWGNYDTVTGAVRWCGNSSSPTGSSTCASTSEVPYALQDTTATPVPPACTRIRSHHHNAPNSFFLTGAAATTATIPCGSAFPSIATRPARRANPSLTTARTSRTETGNLRQRRLSGQRVPGGEQSVRRRNRLYAGPWLDMPTSIRAQLLPRCHGRAAGGSGAYFPSIAQAATPTIL